VKPEFLRLYGIGNAPKHPLWLIVKHLNISHVSCEIAHAPNKVRKGDGCTRSEVHAPPIRNLWVRLKNPLDDIIDIYKIAYRITPDLYRVFLSKNTFENANKWIDLVLVLTVS
jgi:hypothetical protein